MLLIIASIIDSYNSNLVLNFNNFQQLYLFFNPSNQVIHLVYCSFHISFHIIIYNFKHPNVFLSDSHLIIVIVKVKKVDEEVILYFFP